jgi:hypothetical protein
MEDPAAKEIFPVTATAFICQRDKVSKVSREPKSSSHDRERSRPLLIANLFTIGGTRPVWSRRHKTTGSAASR